MKPFLGKPRPRNWGNAHATKRRTGKARTDYAERQVMRGDRRRTKGDYLFANCVVLAAAVFGSSAQRWAEDMLPMARQLDARRLTQ